jgi:hypothetical protein
LTESPDAIGAVAVARIIGCERFVGIPADAWPGVLDELAGDVTKGVAVVGYASGAADALPPNASAAMHPSQRMPRGRAGAARSLPALGEDEPHA